LRDVLLFRSIRGLALESMLLKPILGYFNLWCRFRRWVTL
jgi:hypothetical protein